MTVPTPEASALPPTSIAAPESLDSSRAIGGARRHRARSTSGSRVALLTLAWTIASAATVAAIAFDPSAETGVRAARGAKLGEPGVVQIDLLALSSNDAVEEAAALTDGFRHALAGSIGYAAGPKTPALEAVALAVGCDDPMAPACGAKLATNVKSDRILYGTVKKTPPNKVTVTVAYYDAAQSKTGAIKTAIKTYDSGPVAKDGAAPELEKMALELLYQLVGGPPKAAVDVTVSGLAATGSGDLTEDGNVVGHVDHGHATLSLPMGKHHVVLTIAGFAPSEGDVEVAASGTKLELAPVYLEPPKPFDWKLYGGVGAIGVGAIFLIVGAKDSSDIHSAQTDPTFTEYRHRWPASEPDTCAQARSGVEGPKGNAAYSTRVAGTVADFCDGVKSKQLFQYVWYGLGAALVGGGVYLVLTDKHDDAKAGATSQATSGLRVSVTPIVGPSLAALSLSGSF